jgi:hypothetical protein
MARVDFPAKLSQKFPTNLNVLLRRNRHCCPHILQESPQGGQPSFLLVPPPPPAAGAMPKTSRFTVNEEDKWLARAWVKASQDPIIGTNQTSEMFWEIFFDFWKAFHSLEAPDGVPINPPRNPNALHTPWRKHISTDCKTLFLALKGPLVARLTGSIPQDFFWPSVTVSPRLQFAYHRYCCFYCYCCC